MVGEEAVANTNSEGARLRIDPVVKLELGEGKPVDLPIAAVTHLFVDLRNYNDQFSMGNIMARGLIAMLRYDDSDEQIRQAIGKEGENQQITTATLSLIHQDTLNKIGLTLEPVHGGATLTGSMGEASSSEMRINISDRNRFTSFLGALQPEQVQNTELQTDLGSLSGILAQQVLSNYDLNKPSDETLQLLGGLGTIVEQHKRLGMEREVRGLETYLHHARQGDLREFVVIEQKGLFSEPRESFGPADWQRDCSAKMLEGRWSTALEILRMAKDNPNAKELYEKLKTHLSKCIDIARQDIKSLDYYGSEEKGKIENVLGSTRVLLDTV